MTQDLSEILASLGGMQPGPHQPDGPSSVEPLQPLGLDRQDAEAAPAVGAQQGAGSSAFLTPGSIVGASGGSPVTGWKGGKYASEGGPEQLPLVDGVGRLTAGGNKGANRPS
jgi:hypothetical protein